jgi:hypothetical protein
LGGAAAAAFFGWGGFFGVGFFFFLSASLPEPELEELDDDPEPSFFTFYFNSAGALSNFFLPLPDWLELELDDELDLAPPPIFLLPDFLSPEPPLDGAYGFFSFFSSFELGVALLLSEDDEDDDPLLLSLLTPVSSCQSLRIIGSNNLLTFALNFT